MNSPIPLIGEFSEAEQNHWLRALQAAMPDEQVMPLNQLSEVQKQQATVAIVANPDPALLAQCPNLIWVQSLWAGVEKLIPTFRASPIKLVRLIDPALADTMAEAVLTWCLYLHRNMHVYRAQQTSATWQSHAYVPPQQRTITLLGLGELGQRAAAVLNQHGFRVNGWSRRPKRLTAVDTFAGDDELELALTDADIVVCLLPLTPETHGLLSTEQWKQCKPSACVINFARGAIIDDQALLTALNENQLAHAVLDVFAQEPLPAQHPFWQHPRVTVLPHISAQTRPDTASAIVANHIRAYRQQGTIPASIDFTRGY